MLKVATVLVGVVIAVVAILLVFGGDDPELSSQDQATPTATATPADTSAGTVEVRIADSGLDVEPHRIARAAGRLFLQYDNTTDDAIEVILAKGHPSSPNQIQSALVTGAVIEGGQPRRDGVDIAPGRYTVLVRSPSEDRPPTDAATLQVR